MLNIRAIIQLCFMLYGVFWLMLGVLCIYNSLIAEVFLCGGVSSTCFAAAWFVRKVSV